ncbi:MAG TPA: peptidoglycan-binding domain-containing protein [Azospirillum sp.]|nr:peptidoglycan-binding domain-containing protein [Azospirillum sp.]
MLKLPMMIVSAGMLLTLGACGSTDTQRATTGGLGGAAAGAVVGGPVGAVVGGAAGAGTGMAMDEGLGTKVQDWTGGGSGSTGGQSATQSSDRGTSGGAPQALSPQRVRNIQQALNSNGSDIAVDGIWGPNTRRALRDFQQSQGLEATGQLDSRTVSALNLGRQQDNTGQSGNSGQPARQ